MGFSSDEVMGGEDYPKTASVACVESQQAGSGRQITYQVIANPDDQFMMAIQ